MAFNGKEGEAITLQNGASMTSEYRQRNPNQIIGHFYGKDILKELLDQDGAMGIRIYYGINEDGKKELVLVAADSDENDMLDMVADVSFPCPNACSIPNPLNS